MTALILTVPPPVGFNVSPVIVAGPLITLHTIVRLVALGGYTAIPFASVRA
jgi:hypothetical protein